MIPATLIPSRWRPQTEAELRTKTPGWFNRHVTPVLQFLTSQACTRPIHTLVFFALLASTAHLGLLESSLFESPPKSAGKADFSNLLLGSKVLRAGPETGWTWLTEQNGSSRSVYVKPSQDLALLTFVFPDSSPSSPQSAPPSHHVPIPSNSSAKALPVSSNLLSTFSHDTTMAYALPFTEASVFLASVQEIPAVAEDLNGRQNGDEETFEERRWIMKAVKTNGDRSATPLGWLQEGWSSFLDLLKNAESLDIVIMALGYLSMHLTFISLFQSMRRLGSRFWLGTTVLFSSIFAFMFGLMVTVRMGVKINLVLLSEGLPFLVVIIGFEKPIMLTKAVLSAALESPRSKSKNGKAELGPFTIYEAVQKAVKDCGFEIVRGYCIEIAILSAGAASGIQGGLRQFCFLAAWILFFDGLLLFTLYTSILSIKLEINRIKRHVAIQRALEDDGVSHNVAEKVANSSDWPGLSAAQLEKAKSQGRTIFGGKGSIHSFKVLMVTGFILINIINLLTTSLRASGFNNARALFGLAKVVAPATMDPFKVAGNGLDAVLQTAKANKRAIFVTIFSPIKYELQYPSVHYATRTSKLVGINSDPVLDVMGGRVVESLLKSFEDPVLSKWAIVALAMSLALNGYLFNAARWSLKDPSQPEAPARAEEMQVPPSGLSTPWPKDELASLGEGITRRPSGRDPSTGQGFDLDKLDSQLEKAAKTRTYEDTELMLKDKKATLLADEELIKLALKGKIPGHALEKTLENKTRAVRIRRALVSRTRATRETSTLLESSKLPYEYYDYDRVFGACCENVIGYMPLPVGVAGPLLIDGQNYFLPMATTEGVLVASTSRGCKAINSGGGAVTVVTEDGMTRGPCVSFESVARAGAAKIWLDSAEGQKVMRDAFNSTSRFARLSSMKPALAGTYLFIRFRTTTGDAMGMNMISKGVEHALAVMSNEAGFADMQIVSISGNYCTDKKPSAINWIEGRGKSVVAEATIPGDVVKSVLKTDVDSLVELNMAKNYIGSAMAGSIGGSNAHAANIVAAIFIATGQDPAQVVGSSSCIDVLRNVNGNLQISVSMPCIEVGTIGGGTVLEPQAAMLDLLGVRGPNHSNPGDNARQLARIIAAAVLAAELSLCSALAAGHLVRAHMQHNRSAAPSRSATPAPQPKEHDRPAPPQTSGALAMTGMKEKEKEKEAKV